MINSVNYQTLKK